jgi:hypothetical protein
MMHLAIFAVLATQTQTELRVGDRIVASEVKVVSGTVLHLRRETEGPWIATRIVALRESTQAAIQREARKVTTQWLAEPKDANVDYYVHELGQTLAVWPSFTVFVGNAEKEQVDFELGTKLVLAGLAKLDHMELARLSTHPRFTLQNSEASARARGVGMWAKANRNSKQRTPTSALREQGS